MPGTSTVGGVRKKSDRRSGATPPPIPKLGANSAPSRGAKEACASLRLRVDYKHAQLQKAGSTSVDGSIEAPQINCRCLSLRVLAFPAPPRAVCGAFVALGDGALFAPRPGITGIGANPGARPLWGGEGSVYKSPKRGSRRRSTSHRRTRLLQNMRRVSTRAEIPEPRRLQSPIQRRSK